MAGMKGRSGGSNRKPLADHLAQGTYRPSRHGPIPDSLRHLARGQFAPFEAPEMSPRYDKPAPGPPEPPAWLPPSARREWAELAPALHADGRLAAVDVLAFAGFCLAMAELAWVSSVKGDELHWVTKAYRLRCLRIVLTFARAFGLTPASRLGNPI